MIKKFYHFATALLLTSIGLHAQAQSDWEVLNDEYKRVTYRDIYASGKTIIAVGSDISTFTPTITRSFDGGETWDTLHVGSGPLLRSIKFSSPNKGIITSVNTSSCVLRTTDAGRTWEWSWCDLDSGFTGVNRSSFIDDKIGYMAGWGSTSFSTGAVYKTTDGGVNWKHITGNLPDKPFEYLHFFDEQNGYGGSNLFGHSNLYRTSDGGKTWDTLAVTKFEFADAYFSDVKNGVMVCGNGAIRRTTDAGATWNIIHEESDVIWQGVDFLDAKRGFAVGTDLSFVSKIYATSDSGKTWKEEAKGISMSPVERVKFYNGRGYAVGNGGVILRSKVIDPNASVPNGVSSETIRIFPNPATESIQIQLSEPLHQPTRVVITDVLGRTCMETDLTSESISIESLTPGMYQVQILSGNGAVYTAKLSVKS